MTDSEFLEILNCNDPVELQKSHDEVEKRTTSQYLQDLYARRRMNLRDLQQQYGCESKAALSRIIGCSDVSLSAYMNGKANVCERRARAIEGAMRLPFGTLDKEVP